MYTHMCLFTVRSVFDLKKEHHIVKYVRFILLKMLPTNFLRKTKLFLKNSINPQKKINNNNNNTNKSNQI